MKDKLPEKKWWAEEYDRICKRMEDLRIPKVFGHNDYHPLNMVYDPDKGRA